MSLRSIRTNLSDAARSVDAAVADAEVLGDRAIFAAIEDEGGDITHAIHELLASLPDDEAPDAS